MGRAPGVVTSRTAARSVTKLPVTRGNHQILKKFNTFAMRDSIVELRQAVSLVLKNGVRFESYVGRNLRGSRPRYVTEHCRPLVGRQVYT